MKHLVIKLLGRLGYEIRALEPPPDADLLPSRQERAAVDEAIGVFVQTQQAGTLLADAGAWREYLSDRRLAFFRDVVNVCRKHSVDFKEKQVADVGSGPGYLLRLIAAEAPDSILTGYDTFAAALPLARAICPQAAFEARGLEAINGSFDVIFSTEVLEHLVAPEQALQTLARLLAPGGSLVVTTPNGRRDQQGAGERREDGTAYWGHIHFWSPESWKLFLRRALPADARIKTGQIATGENYAVVRL